MADVTLVALKDRTIDGTARRRGDVFTAGAVHASWLKFIGVAASAVVIDRRDLVPDPEPEKPKRKPARKRTYKRRDLRAE